MVFFLEDQMWVLKKSGMPQKFCLPDICPSLSTKDIFLAQILQQWN